MSAHHDVDILEIFAEAQGRYAEQARDPFGTLHQPVASFRRAYRERNAAVGLCWSCTDVVAEGSVYCVTHRDAGRKRARERYHARKGAV